MFFDFLDGDVTIPNPVDQYDTIGDIVSALLPYILAVAGLGLLLYLILGGFEILVSEGDPEQMNRGRDKITQAIFGFIIIFSAYWLVRILEIIFGIEIWD